MFGRYEETVRAGEGVSAPPRAPGSLLTPTLLIFLTVSALVLTGGVVAVYFESASRGAGQALPGQLRNTYPTMPTAEWKAEAAKVATNLVYVRPDPTSMQYLSPGFIDLGDLLISTLVVKNSDVDPLLVAIDSRTGAVRWQTLIEMYPHKPSCATQAVNGLLPCIGGDAVHFFRLSDGTVDHALPVGEVSRVEVIGADVVTAGYREMSRGTPENLTARWHRTYPQEPGDCPGSGDSQQFGVTDRFIYFGSDVGAVVADAATGQQVIDSQLQGIAVYPGQGLVGRRCSGTTVETVVLDESGRTLRTHAGDGWPARPSLLTKQDRGPYVIGGRAYDFARGAEQWSVDADGARMVGDLILAVESGTMTGYNRNTGEQMWATATPGDPVTSDGERVLCSSDSGVTAVEMRTGRTAWTQHSVTSRGIAPAGTGFAEGTADSIIFYPPTGGAAHAPGPLTTGVAASENSAEGSRLVTKCGKVPVLRPVSYRTDTGALIVKFEIKAACSTGDVVSTSALRITVTAGGQVIASGVFDFGDSPMYLPRTDNSAGTTLREFRYPLGSFWQLPTGSGPSGDQVVECEDQGTSRGPERGEPPSTSAGGTPLTAVRSVLPAGKDSDTVSLAALRARADADKATVAADLADRWVPQISSKRVNLVAPDVDGQMVTWYATDILNQHLRMRLQYPNVRLVWSNEWRSFDLDGWWVTLAGVTSTDADSANRWCDSNGIPTDECFAKIVSNSRDSTGTTRYRR
ncbi:PQQ-binding-like beta-propeller repeat protein [Nocardia huaxiensis]|uniref:PQQ-binding-like beta-propeller repeat protein n=1 Tax=Nocardia huaxiensis TaxID=2755382 RepID=A0A7D6ZQY4_9NOCA|nr:PQQ-binding-like beta-propeller repeat protein [Nocardia huaxiensis]QLY33143.1 PQQ-binding-like beta-propeller repeat protein [Nocardia huaxiensis]